MSIFNFISMVANIACSVINDDNGHPYKDDDGGYFPNNEYDLEGTHYETDDNGSIYRADGEYYPNDVFEIDGTWHSTDGDGNVID